MKYMMKSRVLYEMENTSGVPKEVAAVRSRPCDTRKKSLPRMGSNLSSAPIRFPQVFYVDYSCFASIWERKMNLLSYKCLHVIPAVMG